MQFIKSCFDENAITFTHTLQCIGFSEEQAQRFLPQTANSVLQTENPSDIRNAILDLLSGQPALVLNSIDMEIFSQNLGIPSNQARSGLCAIAPILSNIMSQKKEAIVDVIISLAWHPDGSLTDAAKPIFH